MSKYYVAVDPRHRTADLTGVLAGFRVLRPEGGTGVLAYATPQEAFSAAWLDQEKWPLEIYEVKQSPELRRNVASGIVAAQEWTAEFPPVDLARAFSEVPPNGEQVVKLIEQLPAFGAQEAAGISETAHAFLTELGKRSGADANRDLKGSLRMAGSEVILKSREHDRPDMTLYATNAKSAVNAAFRRWQREMPAVPESVQLRLDCAREQLMSVAGYSSVVHPVMNRLLPALLKLWESGALLYQESEVPGSHGRGRLSLVQLDRDLSSLRQLPFMPAAVRPPSELSETL